MTTTVKCPTCEKLVEWALSNPYRPFCCKRCRLIDLGQWADETYRVPAEDQTNPHTNDDPTRDH